MISKAVTMQALMRPFFDSLCPLRSIFPPLQVGLRWGTSLPWLPWRRSHHFAVLILSGGVSR